MKYFIFVFADILVTQNTYNIYELIIMTTLRNVFLPLPGSAFIKTPRQFIGN